MKDGGMCRQQMRKDGAILEARRGVTQGRAFSRRRQSIIRIRRRWRRSSSIPSVVS